MPGGGATCLISLGKDGVNLGGILLHEWAHKVLEKVGSPLGLRQHQPQQKDALELVVEGDPEELLYDGLCCLHKAIYYPVGEPLRSVLASQLYTFND